MQNIQITAPELGRSLYFNYKGTHSIMLMVVADANYNVIYADLPNAEALPLREKLVPFIFVADDAFA
ncbi:hypothetical protein J437_LFUL015458 [Ladona fulva]|uniref:Uncharacterized protein n=1 Tax=Ladona fulva TaxID=123851 RepID=A0A8K0P1U4_LADFU|nr:hypothetical protein J437_LFUL015458 [Ladona fulva]